MLTNKINIQKYSIQMNRRPLPRFNVVISLRQRRQMQYLANTFWVQRGRGYPCFSCAENCASRILCQIPQWYSGSCSQCVGIASCERSFLKLKLIETYLRSTMSQLRLSSLALLLVERQCGRNSKF